MTVRRTAAASAAVLALGLSGIVPAQAATGTVNEAAAVAGAHNAQRAVAPQGEVTLDFEYQVQETGYWCGPAATRIALSAKGVTRSQADLAAELGTHEGGTDHISQVTTVLNNHIGGYATTEMPNDPPTQEQKDLLWNNIVGSVDSGEAVVANIVAPPGNQPPGYPPDQTIYHYFTVTGYNDVDKTVQIADPASFGGNQIYWLSLDKLASLIPPKGYSS